VAGNHDKPYEGAFVGGTHHFALRVYFEDTDAAGVIYHANYIRFLERARSDMLRALGIDQRASLAAGEGVYYVAEVTIKYRSPGHLDDELLILSTAKDVKAVSCLIHQRVMRGGELLAEADVRAAFLGPDMSPRRQPRAWRENFERLMRIASGE
jgi:acyl-CoA thioester hydrolase